MDFLLHEKLLIKNKTKDTREKRRQWQQKKGNIECKTKQK